jgi:hypothetical protein
MDFSPESSREKIEVAGSYKMLRQSFFHCHVQNSDMTNSTLYPNVMCIYRLNLLYLPSNLHMLSRHETWVNLTEVSDMNHYVKTNTSYLLRAARTAFTAHTGSLVSPTRKVTSQSSGMLARNFMSSARPDLFSKVFKSDSSLCCGASAMMTLLAASGIETSQ